MVVKRGWRVVSGTVAAGAVLVPAATAAASGGIPALEDVQPYFSESNIDEEDADFYQRVADGVPVVFDLETVVSEPTEPSESFESATASEPTQESETASATASESASISEPSESASEPTQESETASATASESASASGDESGSFDEDSDDESASTDSF